MKKHLFLIASVFFAFSAKAQTLAVKKNTNVKVASNTLFYVKGNVALEAYDDGGNTKFANQGNVKIDGSLATSDAAGKNFVNEFPRSAQYGQLIIKQDAANTGRISSEVKFNSVYSLYPLSLPYSGITVKDVVEQVFSKIGGNESNVFVGFEKGRGGYKGFDVDRYKNPLFFWNNEGHSFDQLAAEEQIGAQDNKLARYYAVSSFSVLNDISEDKKKLSGIPVSKNFSITLEPYKVGKNNEMNRWGEAYGSYIVDFTRDMPQDWTNYSYKNKGVEAGEFGENIFYLGNPYTSNIDLMELIKQSSAESKVTAMVQFTTQKYDTDVNVGGASNSYGVNMNGLTGQGLGDDKFQYVRPFDVFALKTTERVSLQFNDNIKTFDAGPQTPNNFYLRQADDSSFFAQVGLDLYDVGGNTGQRTYVAASNVYNSEGEDVTELHNVAIKEDNTGIYTLQDNEELARRGGGEIIY
ncbi:hypothetical protein [Ornithobacterium rhinotracheale]|uniref:hypothetical protein n=1 Tax=Ornithobacterium rhinotracheale TaxID=28251 RepID=UPI001FF61107|nr:hypothetical protein [Ornithobacterium rhinotracheale]MCK0205000.1 hypothetical protein [Ornithobacterium rhinotracheale]